MPRLPRIGPIGIPQHIIQRDNNRQVCFASEQDLAVFASLLDEYATKFSVAVHAWVFMTNHVHLLVTPYAEAGVSKMMQALGRKYVRYFNREYQRSGTLWEGRALGNDRFKDKIEQLSGRRVRAAIMGRPKSRMLSGRKKV